MLLSYQQSTVHININHDLTPDWWRLPECSPLLAVRRLTGGSQDSLGPVCRAVAGRCWSGAGEEGKYLDSVKKYLVSVQKYLVPVKKYLVPG